MDWRAIPGFSLYEISSAGQVRCWHAMAPGRRALSTPRLLRGARDRDGYRRHNLVDDAGGLRCGLGAHVLVLLAFVGPRPGDAQASHLDGDNTNNDVTNLAWETGLENMRRRDEHGRTVRGERVSLAKLTAADVQEIRRRSAAGEGNRPLGRAFGVSGVNIRHIVQRRTWGHVP